MFGNPDYFNTTNSSTADCSQAPSCVFESPVLRDPGSRGHAHLDGDGGSRRPAGPQRRSLLRSYGPSLHIAGLVGLKDTYVHDAGFSPRYCMKMRSRVRYANHVKVRGARAVVQAAQCPLGSVGMNSLVLANRSIVSDNTTYANFLTTIGNINSERDALKQTISLLDGAAFANQPIDDRQGTASSDTAEHSSTRSRIFWRTGPTDRRSIHRQVPEAHRHRRRASKVPRWSFRRALSNLPRPAARRCQWLCITKREKPRVVAAA